MQAERTWTEWFTWHIEQAPFQLQYMRDLAENPIAAQDASAIKVRGGKDSAPLPYRVDPADDADELYAVLLIFGQDVAEKIGGASPRALRERIWRGQTEPQGLPVCTPHEAFSLATEIILWLKACTHQIAHDPDLHDAPDHLIDLIRRMRARYPRSEPKFKAYRPRPCPTCGERTILPIWGSVGLEAMQCDTCKRRWDKTNYPTAGTPTPPQHPASDDPAEPSATGNTKASPHNSTTPADASSAKTTSSPGGATE
ncbi:MAG: hypothetical protein WDA07_05550 [Leucobacter sp.]